jgi:FkbM family methyltransferase
MQALPRHYEFIEIGTSDFATLIKKAGPTTVGLSVEPLGEYLDRLPARAHVAKVEAAVSDSDGDIDIYFIPDSVRIEQGLPSWMKGTNSVGHPHPTVVRYLTKHGKPLSLITTKKVTKVAVATLFERHGVASIDYLKIDTEGHDAVIMHAYLNLIETVPGLRAKRIRFESNALMAKKDHAELCARLTANGYSVTKLSEDTEATLP